MEVGERLLAALRSCDGLWVRRQRKLDTTTLFALLAHGASAGRGMQRVLDYVKRAVACDGHDVPSASAVSRRLRCMPTSVFPHALHRFVVQTAQMNAQNGDTQGSRVLAVDGSKLRVPPALVKEGYASCRAQTKQQGRDTLHPHALLTCILDVHSHMPIAYSLTRSFNERAALIDLLPQCRQGDVLVCDRGYYSLDLLQACAARGVRLLLRVRKNASGEVLNWLQRAPYPRTAVTTAGGIPIRLFKYRAQGTLFLCMTTCTDVPLAKLKEWYRLRWSVETWFRTLKSGLHMKAIRCGSSHTLQHHLHARVLLYVAARVLSPSPAPKWKETRMSTRHGHHIPCAKPVGFLRAADLVVQAVGNTAFLGLHKTVHQATGALSLPRNWAQLRRPCASEPAQQRHHPCAFHCHSTRHNGLSTVISGIALSPSHPQPRCQPSSTHSALSLPQAHAPPPLRPPPGAHSRNRPHHTRAQACQGSSTTALDQRLCDRAELARAQQQQRGTCSDRQTARFDETCQVHSDLDA